MIRCLLLVITALSMFSIITAQQKDIYNSGWIDLNKNSTKDIYEDSSKPIEERIHNLLSQMTIEEKSNQLATLYGFYRVLRDPLPTPNWKNEIWKDGIGNIDEHINGIGDDSDFRFPFSNHADAINKVQQFFIQETRLGIPVDFTNEGIRGLCHYKATYFPSQLGVASSWNKNLVSEIGKITAIEARALGYTNIYSPVLDVARDPRWGRVVESYGENPFLVSELGKRQVSALQINGVVSTVKHFAVYSIPMGGRDGLTRTAPQVSPRDMHQLLLSPFKAAFTEAGALGAMSSYNDYDGIPVSGSSYFLTDLLRNDWGFKGYVVSDSDALEYIHTKHKVAETYEKAAAAAVNAGLNVRTTFNNPIVYIKALRTAIEKGYVAEETINKRVSEVLRVKFISGLFDKPYVENTEAANNIVNSEVHRQTALKAAKESLVLLKNDNSLLPLENNYKTIAVIGPNANEKENLISRYGPADANVISVYEGIKEFAKNSEVLYAKGCNIVDENFPESEILDFPLSMNEQKLIDEAIEVANKSDIVIAVIGGNELTCRENRSRTSLNLTGRQLDLLKALKKTGKEIVAVLINGRPLSINWTNKNIPAIIEAWFPGEFTGRAIAETIFGEYNPGGKLPVTFPKTVGQIPMAFPSRPGAITNGETRVSGALYPFGYGLSYSQFVYSDLKISKTQIHKEGTLDVSFKITNTGEYDGDEVPQIYINDVYSSVITYEKVLRGFERVHIKKGETKTITFTIIPEHLKFLDANMDSIVEPGDFDIFIGSSSDDIRLKGEFEVIE